MSKCGNNSPEFKHKVVELTRMEGVSISQIVKDPGIGAKMLSRWRRVQAKRRSRGVSGPGKGPV